MEKLAEALAIENKQQLEEQLKALHKAFNVPAKQDPPSPKGPIKPTNLRQGPYGGGFDRRGRKF